EQYISGYQFALQLDDNNSYALNSAGELSDENVHLKGSTISVSWNSESAKAFSSKAPMLDLLVLDPVIESDKYVESVLPHLQPEVYNQDLSVRTIRLVNNNEQILKNQVFQNTPNPFSTNTSFNVELAERATVDVHIFNAQ